MHELIEALKVELTRLRQRYPGGMFVGIRRDPMMFGLRVEVRVGGEMMTVALSDMDGIGRAPGAVAEYTVRELEERLKEHLSKQYVYEHR